MKKIVLADDHPMTRIGVKFILQENMDQVFVYEVQDGNELIGIIKRETIDLVVMDLNMPGTDPQRTLQTMLALKPDLAVIIFSMNKEEIFGLHYLKMGAMGYLRKGADDKEVIKAVNCVLGGNIYIAKEMRPYYLADANGTLGQTPFDVLSKKELEVLRHLSKGESPVHISRIMDISSSTISTHKANILAKLKIENMVELRSLLELYGM